LLFNKLPKLKSLVGESLLPLFWPNEPMDLSNDLSLVKALGGEDLVPNKFLNVFYLQSELSIILAALAVRSKLFYEGLLGIGT
jgi:hypothetical protein